MAHVVRTTDYEVPGRGMAERVPANQITAGMDLTKSVIVIEHEPVELHELAAAGVDLDVNGHTHDGQVVPLTIVMDCLWENVYGLMQAGNMTDIVASGAGLFGSNMRTGTIAEICNIHVTFD